MPNKENITLELNVSAPTFDLKDIFGRQINLANYKGKRVFIGFFRHAGCPFCNLRVHALSKVYEDFKSKNMEMVFFFESPEKVLLQSTFHKGVSPIPIISDPQKIMYSMYGIENSVMKSAFSHLGTFIQTAIKAKMNQLPIHPMQAGESITTMPAEFLIDEKGIVKKIHYSRSLNDRLAMDVLREFAGAK